MVNGIGSSAGRCFAGLLMQHLGAKALPLYFAVTLGLLAAYTHTAWCHVMIWSAHLLGTSCLCYECSRTVLELMPDAPANRCHRL